MGFSNLATGFVVALLAAGGVVAMNLWARSSDLRGERVWHVALPALFIVTGLLTAGLLQSAMLVFLALALVAMIQWCAEGPFWALTSSLLRGTAAAGGLALVNGVGAGLGGFIGPALVGVLTESTGSYSAGMAAIAVGPMLAAIIVLTLANSIAPRKLIPERTLS
jgi:ACS family tartrate transporter-like MFS transporter